MKYKIITIAVTFLTTSFLYGCHTAQGFGQDLEVGGKEIQKAATQNNNSSKATTTNSTNTAGSTPTIK